MTMLVVSRRESCLGPLGGSLDHLRRLPLVQLQAALPNGDLADLRRQVDGALGVADVQARCLGILQPTCTDRRVKAMQPEGTICMVSSSALSVQLSCSETNEEICNGWLCQVAEGEMAHLTLGRPFRGFGALQEVSVDTETQPMRSYAP